LEPEFPVVGASATLGRNAEAGAGGADRLIAWAPAAAMVESLGAASGVPFAVSLPDGHRLLSGKGEPAFTVVFHDQTALLATLTRGHVGLLEAYFDERVDLEGDLGRAFAAVMAAGFDLRSSPINAIENRVPQDPPRGGRSLRRDRLRLRGLHVARARDTRRTRDRREHDDRAGRVAARRDRATWAAKRARGAGGGLP